MAPMVGNEELRLAAIAANEQAQQESDFDLENAETVRKFFSDRITAKYGTAAKVFLPSRIIADWICEALPDEHFIRKSIPQIVKNWAKAGMLPEINFTASRYGGHGQRGMGWNFEIRDRGDWVTIPVFGEPIPPKC